MPRTVSWTALIATATANVAAMTECFANRAFPFNITVITRRVHGAALLDQREIMQRRRQTTRRQASAIEDSIIAIRTSLLCRLSGASARITFNRNVRGRLGGASMARQAFPIGLITTRFQPL